MGSRWAAELVEAMRGQTGTAAGADGLMFATVSAEQPVTLQLYDQTISKHLFSSAGLALRTGDEVLVLQVGDAFYILLKVVPL